MTEKILMAVCVIQYLAGFWLMLLWWNDFAQRKGIRLEPALDAVLVFVIWLPLVLWTILDRRK